MEILGGNFRTYNPDVISAVRARLVYIYVHNEPVTENSPNRKKNKNDNVQFEKW